MRAHPSRVLAGVCCSLLVGCSASAGQTTAASASSPSVAASGATLAEQGYTAELLSALIQVTAQVSATDPADLRQLAITWGTAPISGVPLQVERLQWAQTYLANAKQLNTGLQSFQAQEATQMATEQHCFDLAHTLLPGTDQASAQAANNVRLACDSEFGVP